MKALRLFEAYVNITSRNGTMFQVIWRFGSIPARTLNLDFGLLNDTCVYQLHSIFFFLSFNILIDWQLSTWNYCKPFFSLQCNCQFLATCLKYYIRGLPTALFFSGYCFFKDIYYKLLVPNYSVQVRKVWLARNIGNVRRFHAPLELMNNMKASTSHDGPSRCPGETVLPRIHHKQRSTHTDHCLHRSVRFC
jgi:hypothetical protein